LQPLADLILKQELFRESALADPQLLDDLAAPFLGENVPTPVEAWAGATDIVAETISDHADVRRVAREKALQWGVLRSEKIEGRS